MRVLLIEDDSATAQSIELMLKSESFNVYTTDLGEEGVDLGKLYDYDIILLDLNLPDARGAEGIVTLRRQLPDVPITMISADLDSAMISAAMAGRLSMSCCSSASSLAFISGVMYCCWVSAIKVSTFPDT